MKRRDFLQDNNMKRCCRDQKNVYYRVKPDTSKLEEEEKNLAQLQAKREAIQASLESKEKKNTN